MGWKDKGLIALYWLFWVVVSTLAAQEAIYLARGYGQWEWALTLGLCATGAKWLFALFNSDTVDKEQRVSSLLIKRLLLRSGPVSNAIQRVDDPAADPAFAVIVDETVGLENFRKGLDDSAIDWSVRNYVPHEVAAQLLKWQQMNAIDRKLVAVAKRIGNSDRKHLLHDIRIVIMRELYRRIDPKAPDPYPAALNGIIAEVPRLSPIYRLLDATRKEYTGGDSRGIRIGTWEIVESWLEAMPPTKLEDLCGGDGRPLPRLPAIIEAALRSDRSSSIERATLGGEAMKGGKVFISWATEFDVYKGQLNWQDLSLAEREAIVRYELDGVPTDLDIHKFVMASNLRRIQYDGLITIITRVALAVEADLGVRFGSDENAKYSLILPYLEGTAFGQELISLRNGTADEHTNYRMGELEFLAQSGSKPSLLDNLLNLPLDLRLEGILKLLKSKEAFSPPQ